MNGIAEATAVLDGVEQRQPHGYERHNNHERQHDPRNLTTPDSQQHEYSQRELQCRKKDGNRHRDVVGQHACQPHGFHIVLNLVLCSGRVDSLDVTREHKYQSKDKP